jgi:hypothetical protein
MQSLSKKGNPITRVVTRQTKQHGTFNNMKFLLFMLLSTIYLHDIHQYCSQFHTIHQHSLLLLFLLDMLP